MMLRMIMTIGRKERRVLMVEMITTFVTSDDKRSTLALFKFCGVRQPQAKVVLT
jgi:hypothetical protein